MPAAVKVTVGAAGKVGDGVNAYYVFPVTSANVATEPLQVDRRYSDFLWLHHHMKRQCAGYIIPPLPAKVVGFLQGPEFLEQRRAGLERFLRKVVAHDELRDSSFFRAFLECSQVELTALKADASAAGAALDTPRNAGSPASEASFASSPGAALSRSSSFTSTPTSFASVVQQTQMLNSWWGKARQRLAENNQLRLLAARAGHELPRANTIEDPVFDAHVQYLAELDAQVAQLKAKVRAAHRQNKLSAGAYCDLIECMSAMADGEEERGEMPAAYFSAMLALLDTRARQMDGEFDKFATRVDSLARWVKAVQRAVAVREDRRLHYQAQLAACPAADAAEKTPLDDQPDENNNGEPLDNELLEAKDEFETVHARVMKEIARFRSEKAVELRKMFLEFAALQVRCTAELNDVLASSNKTLNEPLPPQLRATGSTSFYDSASSVGSGSGDENNNGDANKVVPAGVPTKSKSRVDAAKASLLKAQQAYSDVRL